MSDSPRQAPKVPIGVLIRVGIATLAASFVVACGSGGSGTLAQQASTIATNAQAKLASATSSSTDSAKPGQTATAPAEANKTETRTVTQPAQSRTVTATRTVSTPGQTTAVTGNNTTVAVNAVSTTPSESGGGVPWWVWVLIGLGVVGVAIAIFQLGRGRRGGSGGGGSRAAAPPREAGSPQADGMPVDPAGQPRGRSQSPPM